MGVPQEKVQRRYDRFWREIPVGYVFMVAGCPKGPLRDTKEAAIQDAVEAREARVDLQYNRVFYNPLTWIAPVYP